MITKSIEPVWKTTLGKEVKSHASLEAAREYELRRQIEHQFPGVPNLNIDQVVTLLLAQAPMLVDILTTTPTSRPSARKLNRAKPRAAKKNTRPASVEDALKHQAGLNASVEPEPTAEEIANLEQQAEPS